MSKKYDNLVDEVQRIDSNEALMYKLDGLSILELSVLAGRLGVDEDSIREKHMDMLFESLKVAIISQITIGELKCRL